MSTSSNMFKNANVEIADIDIDSKPPMLPLKSLTKMFIPTLCYSTDSKVLTMLTMLYMSKITNVENVDKDINSHFVQVDNVDNVEIVSYVQNHQC